MKSVCVYCGASMGARPAYANAAEAFGVALAQRELRLVYGGAHVGLMGVIADSVLAAGGHVIGVIPHSLQQRELAHQGLSELHVVANMAERKDKMAALSDAFVALPGGVGTLDELFETITWSDLGIHNKPSGVLDVDGYWQPLLTMLTSMEREHFVRRPWRDLLSVADSADVLLDRLVARQQSSASGR